MYQPLTVRPSQFLKRRLSNERLYWATEDSATGSSLDPHIWEGPSKIGGGSVLNVLTQLPTFKKILP